jgi:hypothetical protein
MWSYESEVMTDTRAHLLLGEMEKTEGGGNLKGSQLRDTRHCWFDLFDQFDQPGMRDRLTVHLDPLDEVLQVGGNVQSGPVSGSLQRRSHQRGRGPLALRPGHMEDGILLLRTAERSHQRPHPPQVEIGLGEFGGFFEAIIYEGIQVVECLVVGGFGVHIVKAL